MNFSLLFSKLRFPWHVLCIDPLRHRWTRQNMGIDTILRSFHMHHGQSLSKQVKYTKIIIKYIFFLNNFFFLKTCPQTPWVGRRLRPIANCQWCMQIGHWTNKQIGTIPILLPEIRVRTRCQARVSGNPNGSNTKWREKRINEKKTNEGCKNISLNKKMITV